MSALDIRQAKQSLAWWLREWGVTEDPDRKAHRFIDDLVDRGWIMSAAREDRPQPPKRAEECRTHPGQHATNCGGCRADHLAAESDPPAPTLPPVGEVRPGLAKRLAGLSMKEADHG